MCLAVLNDISRAMSFRGCATVNFYTTYSTMTASTRRLSTRNFAPCNWRPNPARTSRCYNRLSPEAAPGIFSWGAAAHCLSRDGRPPVGSRGEAPVSKGSGGQSPPEAGAVCRHCLQILTAETIKISDENRYRQGGRQTDRKTDRQTTTMARK